MDEKINANEIRVGSILKEDEGLWMVLKREHVKLGKGGACVQTVIRNILTGVKKDKGFNSSTKVIKASVFDEEMDCMYRDDYEIHLMDKDFEQISLPIDLLENDEVFLQNDNANGIKITVSKYNDNVIFLKLPTKMVFKIIETDPYIKGQTVTSSFKPAILSCKVKIMVPPFIKLGDSIIINTETREYVERADVKNTDG